MLVNNLIFNLTRLIDSAIVVNPDEPHASFNVIEFDKLIEPLEEHSDLELVGLGNRLDIINDSLDTVTEQLFELVNELMDEQDEETLIGADVKALSSTYNRDTSGVLYLFKRNKYLRIKVIHGTTTENAVIHYYETMKNPGSNIIGMLRNKNDLESLKQKLQEYKEVDTPPQDEDQTPNP